MKALVFYNLLQPQDLVANVQRTSDKLRKLVYGLFELAQTRIELDPDGHQRLYFREPIADFNQDGK